VRQRILLVNALRAHLAEFGVVAGVGRNGLERLLEVIADDRDERVPLSNHAAHTSRYSKQIPLLKCPNCVAGIMGSRSFPLRTPLQVRSPPEVDQRRSRFAQRGYYRRTGRGPVDSIFDFEKVLTYLNEVRPF